MKKHLLLAALLALSTIVAAQTDIPKKQSLKDFSTWSVSGFVSAPAMSLDIRRNQSFYEERPFNLGYGFEVTKQLSHFSAVQFNTFTSNIKLTDKFNEFDYKVGIRQYDLRWRFNLTNGQIFKAYKNTQIFAYVGGGILDFKGEKTAVDETNPYYKKASGTAKVGLIGAGFRHKLTPSTSLFADASYNSTSTDNLEANDDYYTEKDGYSRFSLGLTWNIGSKKTLEWDNPFVYLVPETVHDTTVVIQKIEYVPPVVKVKEPDTAVVYYVTGSWSIEAPYVDALENLFIRAKKLNKQIEILSYCDSSGTSESNMKVIAKRAEKVAEFAARFINEDNIFIYRYDEGFAKYAPEARNRRVVVRIIGMEEDRD
jgi:hypothetical protein